MTLARTLFLLLTVFPVLHAQQLSHPVMVSRDDAFSSPRPFLTGTDTVSILAVMVQFQPDEDARTTGNGRFDLSAPADSIIDAPPRNRQYFIDHLTFVENYYRKASKGKVIVRSTVIDSVYTLPAQMGAYSPPRGGSAEPVANLARDTWQLVDASGRVPDFSLYQCFVVFHAGVGRDIDLVGVLGFDPTPLDIPSLYFGLNAFRQFYGPSYQGIPVQSGAFHITNSIVCPETESRVLPGTTGPVLLELGINGLLCASVGNFLGLPDLFDTNTGRSGIGRFGLMDGQAIFSFGGVFPPEPSAWEKYWLGWIDPALVGPGEHTLSLPAVGFDTANVIYRVPISAREYFLVENRNRDPQRNGQTLASTFNGVARTQTFARDTSGFHAFDISRLAGVVTDVEDLDWSLPGGVTPAGEFFDGGVLIWHVDENVVAAGLASNGVNANPDRRGVDLEEADGSQDIGREFGFLAPGSGSEEGTPLDFWFRTNSSPVYRNEFSGTSFPGTHSNSLANSQIVIRDFSERGPRMTLKVRRGDAQVVPLQSFPRTSGEVLAKVSLTAADLSGDGAPDLLVATTGVPVPDFRPGSPPPSAERRGKLLSWQSSGSPVLPTSPSSGLLAQAGANNQFVVGAAVADLNNNGIADVVLAELTPAGGAGGGVLSTVRGYAAIDQNGNGLADDLFLTPLGRRITTPAVIADSVIALGGAAGMVYFLRLDGSLIDSVKLLTASDSSVAGVSRFTGNNDFIVTGHDGTILRVMKSPGGGAVDPPGPSRRLSAGVVGPAVTGMFGGELRVACVTSDGFLHLLNTGLEPVPGFPVHVGGPVSAPPALADIDGDGSRDVVVFSGNRILAFNIAGASLDHFPITVRSSGPITSHPVVADLDGDGVVEVVAVTDDGLVVAYNRNGRPAAGFPLQAGKGVHTLAVFDVPVAALSRVGVGLAVASSEDGSVSAWMTGTHVMPYLEGSYRPWPQFGKDSRNSGVALEAIPGRPLSQDFFPANRAYNWPNPVYDGRTYIRYFVREDAVVNIRVFDLAGDLVTEFPGPGVGGVDNEVEWNVTGIQSGMYFARIEARGNAGSGIAVVKVAVVK